VKGKEKIRINIVDPNEVYETEKMILEAVVAAVMTVKRLDKKGEEI
jgi:hypothetical protein